METFLLTCSDPDLLAKHSGGFDEDHNCFIAASELPDLPLVHDEVPCGEDAAHRYRKGSVTIVGPVAPKDGIFRVSRALAVLLGMDFTGTQP